MTEEEENEGKNPVQWLSERGMLPPAMDGTMCSRRSTP